ncbi:MAG: flagellar basal body-associated FliL family protein [Deltaproteobacteria bacterium]|nr:flagellar basal body-associated FliL family protein [Deltaproteobacteria bacterium]
MSEEKKAETPSDAVPKAGGSKLGMILGIVNIAVSAFIVVQTMGISHKVTEVEKSLPKDHGPGPESEIKPMVTLDPFVVNLNEQGRARYLKAKFDLELRNDGAKAKLETKKVAIRDDILRYLSSLAVADTLGESGKNTIGEAILARIDKALGGGAISHLYFAEFVVQ